ncbi:hypothetical protein BDZ45DRAFT_695063 [Acephala macrosclerotiorum]|nr:hypothetical protein BDZ45DRAFT_695063 [Acephala macrosclerotiorum]
MDLQAKLFLCDEIEKKRSLLKANEEERDIHSAEYVKADEPFKLAQERMQRLQKDFLNVKDKLDEFKAKFKSLKILRERVFLKLVINDRQAEIREQKLKINFKERIENAIGAYQNEVWPILDVGISIRNRAFEDIKDIKQHDPKYQEDICPRKRQNSRHYIQEYGKFIEVVKWFYDRLRANSLRTVKDELTLRSHKIWREIIAASTDKKNSAEGKEAKLNKGYKFDPEGAWQGYREKNAGRKNGYDNPPSLFGHSQSDNIQIVILYHT